MILRLPVWSERLKSNMSGIKMVVQVGSADKEKTSSFLTIFADNVDDAIQALVDYRSGKINTKIIPQTGIDVRTKDETVFTNG